MGMKVACRLHKKITNNAYITRSEGTIETFGDLPQSTNDYLRICKIWIMRFSYIMRLWEGAWSLSSVVKTVVSFIWQIPVKWLFYVYLGITELIYYSILNDRIFFILITFSNNDNERKRNISQIPIDLTVLKPPSFYDFVLNIHIIYDETSKVTSFYFTWPKK